MRTKFRVGDDAYIADKHTGAVYRRRIVGITITTEEEGAGGPYGLLRRDRCDVSYRLDGEEGLAREETLFERPEDAFRHIDAMTAAAPGGTL